MRPQVSQLARWLCLLPFLAFALFPLYWLAKVALTPTSLLYTEGIRGWPSVTTWQHLLAVWNAGPFPRYFLNSLLVSLSAAVAATLVAALAAYGLARWHFRGKGLVNLFLLLTQMFSVMLIIVPITKLFAAWGLNDSLGGLFILYAALNLPFAIFLMRAFLEALPPDIEEAALIDGYTRLGALRDVLLPLSLPGLGATLGFVFVEAWSELFLAVTLINSESSKTLPVGLLTSISRLGINWGEMAAAGILALLPALLFFALIERFLVSGLTSGAVKG